MLHGKSPTLYGVLIVLGCVAVAVGIVTWIPTGVGSASHDSRGNAALAAGSPVGSISFVGIGLFAAAATSFSTSSADAATLAGVAALLAAAVLAERYPVPLHGIDTGGVSLGFVFCVATTILYGWAAGVVVAFAAPVMHLIERRPPIRVAYNASVLAIAAAAAGGAVQPLRGEEDARLLAQVAACAAVHYGLNLVLISLVVGVSGRQPLLRVARASLSITIVPFALMGSAALILVVLWQRSPLLSATLVGPLLAIALYQRSSFTALRAMRLAMTDPLTSLGNHRHFHDRLRRELADSHAQDYPLSLCLVDVDDFKRINDRFGHRTPRATRCWRTSPRSCGRAARRSGSATSSRSSFQGATTRGRGPRRRRSCSASRPSSSSQPDW